MLCKFFRRCCAGLLSLGLILCCCGCKEEQQSEIELLKPVGNEEQTYVAEYTDVVAYHCNSDVTVAARSQAVYFAAGGYVGNYEVSIGDTVKKGQLLVVLDDAQLSEQYEQILTQIQALKSDHEYETAMLECNIEIEELRLIQLKNDKADELQIAKQQLSLEEAELSLKQTKEQYELDLTQLERQRNEYKLQLENNKLYAPMDGVVAYLPDTTKQRVYLSDTQPAVIITDPSQLTLKIDYISDTKAYQTYTHYTASVDGTEYDLILHQPTREEYLAAVTDNRSVYTEFEFVNGVPDDVTTASSVSVNMYYYEAKNVLTVPYHALQYDGEAYSLDIMRDGKRFIQTVTVEKLTSTEAVISEGLQEGDIVYV